jgi:hypothetical protein
VSAGICQAHRPFGSFDDGCSVTGCESPTAAVVEVGGSQLIAVLRLCALHRAALRAALDPRRFQ